MKLVKLVGRLKSSLKKPGGQRDKRTEKMYRQRHLMMRHRRIRLLFIYRM